MKTKRPVHDKCKKITSVIPKSKLNEFAFLSGFKKRKHRKISPLMIIASYLNFISHGKFSFRAWAIELSTMIGCSVSKQGVFKRITPDFVNYIKLVLTQLLSKSMLDKKNQTQLFSKFKNVYLHDSSCYSLPLQLVKEFPGNICVGLKRAVAKVQVVFNLTQRRFSYFALTSYRDADTNSTILVNSLLKSGDLIIRDLGYFSMTCFKQIAKANAYFLSHYKQNVAIRLQPQDQPVKLSKLLKKKGRLDCQVWLSSLVPFPVRLIAVPVPDCVANKRRRKVQKNDRNERGNHNQEYYQLLGYDIYITNVTENIWTPQEAIEAYRCRWFIETIFKSWKSHLNSHYTAPDCYANKISVEAHFYLLMIYVCVIIMPLYMALESYCKKAKNKIQISILKLTSYVAKQLDELINLDFSKEQLELITYHVKYDKRNDRINFSQRLYND
jgi:hypothetical protein